MLQLSKSAYFLPIVIIHLSRFKTTNRNAEPQITKNGRLKQKWNEQMSRVDKVVVAIE